MRKSRSLSAARSGTIRSRLHRGRQLLRQHILLLQQQDENGETEREEDLNLHDGRLLHRFPNRREL